MTANRLLGNSLEALAAKLGELAEEYPAELKPVCEVLATISARRDEPNDFRRNLKDLAEAVIHVRTRPNCPPRFRELPVPPYDLWLPFKAEDLTPSDPEAMPEAIRIFNEKVSEAAFRMHCVIPDAVADGGPRADAETPASGSAEGSDA